MTVRTRINPDYQAGYDDGYEAGRAAAEAEYFPTRAKLVEILRQAGPAGMGRGELQTAFPGMTYRAIAVALGKLRARGLADVHHWPDMKPSLRFHWWAKEHYPTERPHREVTRRTAQRAAKRANPRPPARPVASRLVSSVFDLGAAK